MNLGYIHSFQSLGTLDGPGVRFVVFMQGCNLRCSCCHNPDTWKLNEGKQYSPEEIVQKVIRYREYYQDDGGITVSGGEPLLQAEFVYELFRMCHEEGIHTCLDTSGSIWNPSVERLLSETDYVLLDIKYTEEELYQKYVGCSLEAPLEFLSHLDSLNIPTRIRQVIIPTINDDSVQIEQLAHLVNQYSCVERVELLPFKKICQVKYDEMGITFPFSEIPAADKTQVLELENSLKNGLKEIL